jgi:hypothetical protein
MVEVSDWVKRCEIESIDVTANENLREEADEVESKG